MKSRSAPGRQVERQLVAILAADIAGYSRLMGADEEGTHARVRDYRRAVIDPALARHRGRIVNTAGDGFLAEFASPVEAVRCAVAMQQAFQRRNRDVPEESQARLRIGINLGDVIIDDRDLYGDAVNIAARLEALAEPGGICISRAVRDQIRDRLDLPFADRGEQTVKNITRPVRIYALAPDAVTAVPEAGRADVPRRPRPRPAYARPVAAAAFAGLLAILGIGLWLWLPAGPPALSVAAPDAGKPTPRPPHLSIVVLPFENYGAGHDQDYFADGITEDLTTDLSRIPGSFVIARNTAFTYKNRHLGARQIGSELGVRYVLEGSVQRAGDRVRVNAQLIDAASGAHLWAERFDRQVANLLQIQDEITRHIAWALSIELVEAESERARREHVVNPDAVDLAMRGQALLFKPLSAERDAQARRWFEQALAIDPKNVEALLGLAVTYLRDATDFSIRDLGEGSRLATDAADRALAIDPQNAEAYMVKSYALAYSTERHYRGRIDQAIDAAETALRLNPNLVAVYAGLGRLYSKAGHPERTPALIEQAIRLSPRDPRMINWLYILGTAQLQMGHAAAAIATFRKALVLNPDHFISQCNLAAAYLAAGHDSEARDALTAARRMAEGAALKRQPARIEDQLHGMRVQLALLRRDYWPFAVEGSATPLFSRALRAFQRDQHLPETGLADPATLARLGVPAPAAAASTR